MTNEELLQRRRETFDEVARTSGYANFQDMHDTYLKLHGYFDTVLMHERVYQQVIKIIYK